MKTEESTPSWVTWFAGSWAYGLLMASWAALTVVVASTSSWFTRFARWRRDSGSWAYGLLMASWAALTVVVASVVDGWQIYAASAALFALTFEVGWAYVFGAGWGSIRQLEHEGFEATLAELYLAGYPDDQICQELKISLDVLRRFKAQMPQGESQ